MIMSLFNEFSYELDIAKSLYHYDKDETIDSDGFHFFTFLGYIVYLGFNKIGVSLNWQRMQIYHRSLEEVRQQLDVRLIMKKILYQERLSSAILEKPKSKLLHIQEPMTLEEAE